jgi:hypothetical protein
VFSSTGFKSKSMSTEGDAPLTISMKREVAEMEEVVINVVY